MRVLGGETVGVFRSAGLPATFPADLGRDRHGDGQLSHIGDIGNCIVQPVRTAPVEVFGEVAEVGVVLWAPRAAQIKLKDKDRVVLHGHMYRVIGPPMYTGNHPVTGSFSSHYAVQIEAVA